MSVRIGEIHAIAYESRADDRVVVHASRSSVEIHTISHLFLEPVEARNLAALLVRAADEAERMRAREKSDG